MLPLPLFPSRRSAPPFIFNSTVSLLRFAHTFSPPFLFFHLFPYPPPIFFFLSHAQVYPFSVFVFFLFKTFYLFLMFFFPSYVYLIFVLFSPYLSFFHSSSVLFSFSCHILLPLFSFTHLFHFFSLFSSSSTLSTCVSISPNLPFLSLNFLQLYFLLTLAFHTWNSLPYISFSLPLAILLPFPQIHRHMTLTQSSPFPPLHTHLLALFSPSLGLLGGKGWPVNIK